MAHSEEYTAAGKPDDFDWGCQGEPGDHETPTLVQSVFPNTPDAYVWSGSLVAGNSDSLWVVYFDGGLCRLQRQL